ncbi:hypothetical protein SDC9_155322 [bioreactor metagenome]|uniref:Uncharacterized protein n=1 Tax=bioreactor metagenome TaxID=1076179 RepID=A0A645F352_9ZZZZ
MASLAFARPVLALSATLISTSLPTTIEYNCEAVADPETVESTTSFSPIGVLCASTFTDLTVPLMVLPI